MEEFVEIDHDYMYYALPVQCEPEILTSKVCLLLLR